MDDYPEHAVYDIVELKIDPKVTAYFTADSGSDKEAYEKLVESYN